MQCIACAQAEFTTAFLNVKDFEYEAYHSVDYAVCSYCGLVAEEPPPERSAILAWYPQHYRNYQADSGGLFSFLKSVQERGFARRLAKVFADKNAKILEIGSGNGALLGALGKEGFKNLSGSDFSRSVRVMPGVRFKEGNIEEHFPYEETFDVVIMINAIEHFLDPVSVLKHCRDHLSPHGKIILMTPNAGSLALQVFGRYWAGFHAPRHIFLFTKKSFEELGKKIGMSKVVCQKTAEPGQWSLSIQNILQDTSWGKTKLHNGLAWYANVLSIALMPVALIQNLTSKPASLFCVLQK